MFRRYENFLKDFDELLKLLYQNQSQNIKCKKGCSKCCKGGEFPCSQLEFAFITKGYLSLDEKTKILVQQNIRNLLLDKKEFKGERFEHTCPFLLNDECTIYEYRGILCRVFGLCYYDDEKGYVRLPECAKEGLNYSEYYDKETGELNFENVPKVNLRIDKVLNSALAKQYLLESGEIRPMLEWFGDVK